jgi:hypothetical protein
MSAPSKRAMEIATEVLIDRQPAMGGNRWTTVRLAKKIDEMVSEEHERCLCYFDEARMGSMSTEDARKAIESGEWPEESGDRCR